MKGTMIKALLLGTLLLTFLLPVDVKAVNINLVSDTTWTVTDANGNDLGKAQRVCLNATAPSNCPTGAMSYGYTLPGWTADLSSIPGATWIWAPGITGATSPAANLKFTFQKEFYFCGSPKDGTISIAADDSAEIILNGHSEPITTPVSWSALSTVNIPAADFLKGLNILQVTVTNGNNPSDCGSDQYKCNPAGFVLGASFADALPALPTCTGTNGTKVSVGGSETLSCPSGQIGSNSRVCACLNETFTFWISANSCHLPPTTCTATNGTTVSVGATENRACAAPNVGADTFTCGSNGSWSLTSSSCAPPPITCTATNGTTVSVGATENRACAAPKIGADTFACGSNGSWSLTSSSCALPLVGVGDKCGAIDEVPPVSRECPSGTSCKSSYTPPPARPWWCFFTPFNPDCSQKGLYSRDWFCLAD